MPNDDFGELARYYDPLMEHVNYDRWFRTCVALTELLPGRFQHVDVGCGTGVLLAMLRAVGWSSVGVDLSPAMIQAARKRRGRLPVGVADVRALPFFGSAGLLTCLFDSINFLLEEEAVRRALLEMARSLAPGGVLYFDMVTERMVTEHFAGQRWEEDNGGFVSNWSSQYDRKSACTETKVRINSGNESVLRERIYPQRLFESALRDAGLTLLGVFDAEDWAGPRRTTTRVDFVAVKQPARGVNREFKRVRDAVRSMLREDARK